MPYAEYYQRRIDNHDFIMAHGRRLAHPCDECAKRNQPCIRLDTPNSPSNLCAHCAKRSVRCSRDRRLDASLGSDNTAATEGENSDMHSTPPISLNDAVAEEEAVNSEQPSFTAPPVPSTPANTVPDVGRAKKRVRTDTSTPFRGFPGDDASSPERTLRPRTTGSNISATPAPQNSAPSLATDNNSNLSSTVAALEARLQAIEQILTSPTAESQVASLHMRLIAAEMNVADLREQVKVLERDNAEKREEELAALKDEIRELKEWVGLI